MLKRLPSIQCHPHDEDYVTAHLRKFPQRLQTFVIRDYNRRYTQGHRGARGDANEALRELSGRLPAKGYRLAADDDELVEYAKRWAGRSIEIAAGTMDPEEAYGKLAKYAKSRGIDPPQVTEDGLTYEGAIARLKDEMWWRRAIRHDHGRTVEQIARELFMVHKDAGIYSSDETVHRRRTSKRRNRRMLDEVMAVNEEGQEFTLSELSDLSVSNPVIRRGELMVRIAGFEQVADALGHSGEFITVTCPSRMHRAISSKYGRAIPNPKYDGTNPREAQHYLANVWARIRSKLARDGIRLYGFRVAEPHHDGCPHWHFLMFFPPEHAEHIRAVFKHYALKADGDEPGAYKRRITFKAIDKRKGTAAGYIAKYIAKNIDGHGLDTDLYGTEAVEGAERVDAWASCWGIRQFQQIGGPPVTVWRELRRLSDHEDGVLEEARHAADTGDWAAYIEAMGGPTASRAELPIRPAYWQDIDTQTGELPLNRYGELATSRLFGLAVGSTYVMTRWHNWTISRRATEDCGTVATIASLERSKYGPIVRRAAETLAEGASPPPWSSVNNCTRPHWLQPKAASGNARHLTAASTLWDQPDFQPCPFRCAHPQPV